MSVAAAGLTLGFDINRVTTPQSDVTLQVGRTPLMKSIERGQLATATALASHPSTNLETRTISGDTAIMFFVTEAGLDLSMVRMLLARGADPLVVNTQGYNAVLCRCLRSSISPSDMEAIGLLLDHGVDIGSRIESRRQASCDRGRSAAALILRSHCAVPEALRVLQKHVFGSPRQRALIESADAWGGGLLHYAAEGGFAAPVRALLAHGARVNAERECEMMVKGVQVNEDGTVGGVGAEMETPLDVARARRRLLGGFYRSPTETTMRMDEIDMVIEELIKAGGRGRQGCAM